MLAYASLFYASMQLIGMLTADFAAQIINPFAYAKLLSMFLSGM
jgi:hypothetical protein